MTELNEAVDDLTLPKPVKVQTDTGHTWATEDALLVQLQEAISSSLRSGSGSGGAPWTRNVLDGDALYRAAIITSTIGDWCRIAGVKATRDPVADLRAWHAAFLAFHESETFYLDQMRKWAGEIRAMMSPPKTLEITKPCPVCKTADYLDDDGETMPNKLVMTYRADTPNMDRTAKVACRNPDCDAEWVGAEAMVELSDELDEKEITPM